MMERKLNTQWKRFRGYQMWSHAVLGTWKEAENSRACPLPLGWQAIPESKKTRHFPTTVELERLSMFRICLLTSHPNSRASAEQIGQIFRV
jgi:hypothetical protein